jgi:flagellar hook assembly protein FlgD
MHIKKLPAFISLIFLGFLASAGSVSAQTVDVTWTDLVGVSAAGNTITKTAGTAWGNAGAASTYIIPGDGGVDFRANETNTYRMAGLSPTNTDANYTTIKYALYLYATGVVYIFESGTSRGTFGSYVVGDRFSVERTGTTITYKKNGTTLYTSTIASSGALLVDSSLYTINATIADAKMWGVAPQAASIISPAAGFPLLGGTMTFQWNAGAGVTEYRLGLATTQAALATMGDIYDQSQGTSTSATVTGIPVNGQPVYVRLWSLINGVWSWRDYTYQTASPILFGGTVAAPIGLTGEIDYYRLSVNANEKITIPFKQTGGAAAFNPMIQIYNNQGVLVTQATHNYLGALTATLTAAGDYFIWVGDDNWFEVGSYEFTPRWLTNTNNVTAINSGDTITGTTTSPTAFHVYKVTAAANQKITIPFKQTGTTATPFNPWVRIYDSQGILVAQAAHDYLATVTATLTAAGDYFIWVGDDNWFEVGSYEFTPRWLTNTDNATAINFGDTITGTTTSPTAFHVYKITAAANEKITIPFKQTGGVAPFNPWVRVFDSQGVLVAQAWHDYLATVTATLTAAGDYFIWVGDDNYYEVGSYEFTLDDNLVIDVSTSPVFINPVINENSALQFTVQLESNVSINVYQASFNSAGVLQKVFARNLTTGTLMPAGTNSFVWDGKDALGAPMPPAVYVYTIEATSTDGTRHMLYDPEYVVGTVQIQNGALSPANFDPYQGESAVITYGLVVPAWVTLKVGVLGQPSPHRVLINSEPRDVLNNIDYWDGRDNNGNIVAGASYIVAGWTNLLPDNAIVIKPNLSVSSLTAQPYAFYPVYNESAEIKYTLSDNALVTVAVKTPNGSLTARVLVNNQPRAAGTHTVTWDGRDDFGNLISVPGDYRVHVTATHPTVNNTVTRTGNITVLQAK